MKMKQVFAVLLSALLLLAAALPVWADEGDNDAPFLEPTTNEEASTEGKPPEEEPVPVEGLTFDALGTYPLSKAFRSNPRTLAAEILVPASQTGSAGVIFSNEDENGTDAYLTFEIFKNGVPRVVYKNRDGISYDFRFENVDVRGEDWVHLAIVMAPDANEMHCYVNGALAETLTMDRSEKPYADYHPDSAVNPFFLGGDATAQNPNYFTGAMRSLAVFDAPRSAAQIRSDVTNGVDAADASLLCLYALGAQTLTGGADDLSANGNDVTSERKWFSVSGGAYTGEYDYSLAVVGDTQSLTYRYNNNAYKDALPNLYDWIVDHAAEKKMQYVIGLGDVTETDTDGEWTFAKNAITKLDGVLPYSLVRGQGHDTVTMMNKYFAEHTPFTENLGGTFKEGSVASAWQELAVGETKYLILSLDFGAPDEILTWASGIIESHPEHRVIVTTHAYLDVDGTTRDRGEMHNAPAYALQEDADSLGAKNDGDELWRKFISKHENIFLVLSGHISAEDVVINQRKGDAGNTVTEMLIDPQTMDGEYAGGTGMVAMLYFSHESDVVGVEYYSTVMDAYRPVQSFDVNHTHAYGDTVVPPTCESYGYTAHICACGHALGNTNLVPKLPHTYDDAYDADCNVCGAMREVDERPVQTDSEIASEPESEPTSEPETESAADGGSEEPSASEPETQPAPAPDSETETEPETEARAPNGSGDGDGGMSVGTVIAICTVGGVAVLGGGGFALWTLVLKKKK